MPSSPKDLNVPVLQAIFGCFESRVSSGVLFFYILRKLKSWCSAVAVRQLLDSERDPICWSWCLHTDGLKLGPYQINQLGDVAFILLSSLAFSLETIWQVANSLGSCCQESWQLQNSMVYCFNWIMFLNLGASLVTTPGLEQAVLLVLEMEPLLYLYPFFVASSFSLLFLSISFLRLSCGLFRSEQTGGACVNRWNVKLNPVGQII